MKLTRILLACTCLAAASTTFAQVSLNKVADYSTAAPWGSNYNSFSFPKVSGDNAYVLAGTPSGRGFVRFREGQSFSIADFSQTIPGQSVTWTNFLTGDADGEKFAFMGGGSEVSGVYLFDGSTVSIVADNSVLVPGSSVLFTNFGAPVLRGGNVAFIGHTAEPARRSGVFVWQGDSLQPVIAPGTAYPGGTGSIGLTTQIGYGGGSGIAAIAPDTEDSSRRALLYAESGLVTKLIEVNVTTVPGRTNVFTGLSNPPFIAGNKVYFGGSFEGGSGIYSVNTDGTGLAVVVDTSMTPPGKVQKFISTFLRGVTPDHHVYFEGTDGSFGHGAYRSAGGVISKLVATYETLSGKTVVALNCSSDPSGDELVVLVTFSDDTRAMFRTGAAPVPQFRLTKSVRPSASGIITVNPSSTNAYYASNTIVNLTATPNSGFRFVRWSGANNSTNTSINIAMRTNKSVTALFTNLSKYKISTAVKPAAAGTITLTPFAPTNIYYAGSTVTLTATPQGTNAFSAWVGAAPALADTASITVNANKSVTALFNNPGKFLFQNSSGQLAVWFLQNTQRLASVMLNNGTSAGSNWRLAATADMDANGSKDLIFRGTNGQASVWLMNGNIPVESVLLRDGEVVDPRWRLVGAGDFGCDGSVELLWQGTNNILNVWSMEALNYQSDTNLAYTPSGGYRAVALGNFNANASPDIVLQNVNGQVAVWFMDGLTRTGAKVLNGGVSAGTGWLVAGATDLNNDDKTDLVFRRSDGAIKVWLMDYARVLQSVVLPTKAASPWVLRAVK